MNSQSDHEDVPVDPKTCNNVDNLVDKIVDYLANEELLVSNRSKGEDHVVTNSETAAPIELHDNGSQHSGDVGIAQVASHTASSTPCAVPHAKSVNQNIMADDGGAAPNGGARPLDVCPKVDEHVKMYLSLCQKSI